MKFGNSLAYIPYQAMRSHVIPNNKNHHIKFKTKLKSHAMHFIHNSSYGNAVNWYLTTNICVWYLLTS